MLRNLRTLDVACLSESANRNGVRTQRDQGEEVKRVCILLACASAQLLTACATPALMVRAHDITPERLARIQAIECVRLVELLAQERERERMLSSDMDTRAAKQLLLNAIGVAALAYGGFGIAYSVRGEGQRRDDLRESRAEIEAMTKVLTDKSCRPDVPAPATVQKPASVPEKVPSEPAKAAEPVMPVSPEPAGNRAVISARIAKVDLLTPPPAP